METLCEAIGKNPGLLNENQIMEKLSNALDNGGDINFIFCQKSEDEEIYYGTILHYSIIWNYDRLVEYALSRGADIAIKRTSKGENLRNWNALELAIYEINHASNIGRNNCYETLTNRSLQLYSSYDLTPFHLECARDFFYWPAEAKEDIRTCTAVNAAVSAESPLWPGMTPLLIAAKFENELLVNRLLNLGADPAVQDSEGNTPLHYFNHYFDSCITDEWSMTLLAKLFAFDGKNTFSSQLGESHFHFACHYCAFDPELALNIVQRYLDQGISPDLQKENDKDAGKVGLHIAAEIACPQLIQLLLEYGADIDKEDCRGFTPIVLLWDKNCNLNYYISSLCLLIEAGANTERVDANLWIPYLSLVNSWYPRIVFKAQHDIFRCFIKLNTLNKNLVPQKLKDIYDGVLEGLHSRHWDGTDSYAGECSKELRALSNLGLRQILKNAIIVKSDFKHKFGWLDSFDFESYSIYGSLLKMRVKRDFLEFEKKKTIIPEAIPRLQSLLQHYSQFRLPHVCASLILWNLNGKELDQFMDEVCFNSSGSTSVQGNLL